MSAVVDPTPCPSCERQTRTIAGVCPNCGVAKPDGVVPGWIRPSARLPKSTFSDTFGAAGPYVALAGGACVLGVIAAAAALVGLLAVVAVAEIVLLAWFVIAGLVDGAIG
jgi:hypothetical protein